MDKVQELLIKMLKRNSFFKDMCDESLLKFSNLFVLDMLNKQEAIIIEWKSPEYVYILKKWNLVAKKANGLNSVILWQIQEWEVFGEIGYFYKQPAIASVVCESDTASFWKISKEDLDKFLEENPKLKTKMMETLSRREKENKQTLWWNFNLNQNDNSNSLDDIKINL